MNKISINLCLSGGGTRGFAHMGVMKALMEEGICFSNISGTSSGAIAGAFIAASHSPDKCMAYFNEKKLRNFMNSSFNFGLLTLEKNVAKFFRNYLPETFEELSIPLYVNAVDLLKGRTVFFSQGSLITPLTASASIPAFFKPVSYQNHLLVDGGVLNNLPVEPLLGFKQPLVAVHVNPVGDISSPKNSFGILERTFHLAVYSNVSERKKSCAIIIEPPALANFRVFNFKRSEEIFNTGYEYIKHNITDIKNRLNAYK